MSQSQSCGNCTNQTHRQPLCEQCNDDDINNNQGMAFAIEQLEAEVKPLRAREPLVQEVIRLIDVYDTDCPPGELGNRRHDALEACRKLSRWRP
jgi:hypothetical protein